MKLFDEIEQPTIVLSQEQFSNYYKTASVVSLESMQGFLANVKDSFVAAQNAVYSDQEKALLDCMSNRFKTEYEAKQLKFNNIKDYTVLKPENFNGKYVDYLKDLTLASTELVSNTEASLNNLKLAISSFINEYSEEKVYSLYGVSYFRESEKITEKVTKLISKYFGKNGSTKANISDVLKSLSDIPVIYSSVETIEKIINEDKIKYIQKLSLEVSDLIDLLIEQNKTSGVLLKNDSAKKDLVNIIHISAKQIELVSYLYSNIIFMYNSINNLSEFILAKAKQN